MNPYEIVDRFEQTVAEYAGSEYAVAVNSCTSALFLSLMYRGVGDKEVFIPSYTYKSVPDAIYHAGGFVVFEQREWKGIYYLNPVGIVDGAKRFTKGMYEKGTLHCLSFHRKKILNIGEGGMILTDNKHAYEWLKLARFNGRHEVDYYQDHFAMVGWNVVMSPEKATIGLMLMQFMPSYNEDQKESYTDLSIYENLYKKY